MDKNCWRTPDDLFGPLNAEFNFGLDACASHGAEKCPAYISPDEDALSVEWSHFMATCGVAGRTVWFRKLAEVAAQIRFTTGRVAFLHPETGEQMKGNNAAQAIFVLNHTRTYDERVVWFDV